MTELDPHFLASALALKLTEREKNDARELLEARMHFPHAVGALSALSGAWSLSPNERVNAREALIEAMHQTRGFSSFSLKRLLASISAGLALLMAGGGALAYAAESALPGDILYSVKVSVNEPVIGLLQRTPQEKAQWAARRLERRLSEARALVAKATEERQRDAQSVPAAISVSSSESSSTSEALTVHVKAKEKEQEKTVRLTAPKAPDREYGMTEKQGAELDALVHAGVPDIRIKSWIHALHGSQKQSSSNGSSLENGRGEESSGSSSSTALQSPSSSASQAKNKNKHSSSDALGAIVSSDNDSAFLSSSLTSSSLPSPLPVSPPPTPAVPSIGL